MMDYDAIDAYESSIPGETQLMATQRAQLDEAREVITMSPRRYAAWRKDMLDSAALCDWPDWALDEIEEIQAVEVADACRRYMAEGKTVDEAMRLMGDRVHLICL